MIIFKDGQLLVTDFEKGKDLHVVRKENGFDYYLTNSNAILHGFFEVPQRLVWTPDLKQLQDLLQLLVSFLDDLPLNHDLSR